MHAACVISLEKARVSFEPMLRSLQIRMIHIMDRLCPVAEYMVLENRDRAKVSSSFDLDKDKSEERSAMDILHNPQFRNLIRSIFEKFVRSNADSVSLISTIAISFVTAKDILTHIIHFVG